VGGSGVAVGGTRVAVGWACVTGVEVSAALVVAADGVFDGSESPPPQAMLSVAAITAIIRMIFDKGPSRSERKKSPR
jgi:hypothetical protein